MPERQIFSDPQRKRWKRLRRVLDICAVLGTFIIVAFIFNILRIQKLPELLLPTPRHNYKALPDLSDKYVRPARRRTNRKPSEIPLNTGEGLRAAYYVQDDEASYASLKDHVQQIDLLFPQWLHVDAPSGAMMAMSADNLSEYPVVEGNTVHDPDSLNKVKDLILKAKVDTEIFPHLNNYDPHTQSWNQEIGTVIEDPGKSAALRGQIMRFFAVYPAYRGLSLDFELLSDKSDPAYIAFIQALYSQMHRRNLRLYVNTAIATTDDDFKAIAANSDGIILMNYDQDLVPSQPDPHSQNRSQGKDHLRRRQLRIRLDALHPQRSEGQTESPQHRGSLRLRCLGARVRCRRRSRPQLRLAESALRVH
jgi:hypothetical protein